MAAHQPARANNRWGHAIPETTTATRIDRATLRDQVTAMQPVFAQLVGEIGDAHWRTTSGIPAWQCGQLAWHVAQGMSFQAGQIEAAAKGKAPNPPSFLWPALFKFNEFRVRLASRKATPASVRADFDTGSQQLLRVFDAMDDATIAQSATAVGETRTIASMYQRVIDHLAEHAAHIRAGLPA